jgi:DNA-binding NarL/FixJ family response regulator
VVFSGSRWPGDIQCAYAGGADFYVEKPADWDLFSAAIASVAQAACTHKLLNGHTPGLIFAGLSQHNSPSLPLTHHNPLPK